MIELKKITAGRAGKKLFGNFSWRINEGDHWLISGPNGSGKTLLLEMLAGHIHITEGKIDIDFIRGKSWDDRFAERKKNIHYIPAHAIQNLLHQNHEQYYQQRYYGVGDERVPMVKDIMGQNVQTLDNLELPESFAINALLGLEINRLSNGQLKKVLLLKVLLTGVPKLLLLDYPFEGLDITSRKDLCDLIDFMATKYGTQIIVVDQHHHLPNVVNKKLTLRDFHIASEESFEPSSDKVKPFEMRTLYHADIREPVIEIKDLKIQYGETVILEKFNWTVRKGERWALVGRNGAGKTTLFSMIFADHPMAYSQEIYLFGRRRGSGESIWDIKRRISYLGPEQMSYLSPNHITMTARQFIRSASRKWDQQLFTQLADAFDAASFLDKPVRVLSSGELQIVLIVNCLMSKGEVVLLDEPFQFLDSTQKSRLTAYLSTYLDHDSTLILITHYENDLREWTDYTKRI